MARRRSRATEAAIAALAVAAASGLALSLAYDPGDALASVARMLLVDRAASVARNLHFWSALAFVLLAIAALLAQLRGSVPDALAALAALALVAGSGFALRGEHGSMRALEAVAGTLNAIPGIGPLVATALVGSDGGLTGLLFHHAVTFTLLAMWLLSGRRRPSWPRWPLVAATLVPAMLLSPWLAPALDDGLPGEVDMARPSQGSGPSWRVVARNWFVRDWVFAAADPAAASARERGLPRALGRPEGCLVCHVGVTGLSAAHDPAVLGCASCHRGNVYSLRAPVAHDGMLVVPGNLADARRTCGGDCHADVVARVERSLMSTLAGIVTVNRNAWGERHDDATPHIARIGHSPADSHLRQLCALCHLGAPKSEPEAVNEQPQGGGCTACHVRYGPAARTALERRREARAATASTAGVASGSDSATTPRAVPLTAHPDVALPVDNAPCFGCHSRSGRISLSYDGWHEANPPPAETQRAGTRTLDDGRVVVQVAPDTHSTRGLACIDCHTATEVMGDGTRHGRQTEQLRVACGDCHPHRRPLTTDASGLDGGSHRILRLRKLGETSPRILATASGDVLLNAHVDADGRARLLRKGDGAALELRPASPRCRDAVHSRVSCIGCHTAWAPRCPACHTRYDPQAKGYDLLDDRDVQGEWIESSGPFTAVPPTLGMRRNDVLGVRRETVDPFVPGMIATFDGSKAPGGAPEPVFRRWYARAFSHTVSKAGRSCASCHSDPVALGYGEGRLEFVAAGPGRGRWRFVASHAPGPDGLPADAWIGFQRTRTHDVSTRDDVRPLSVAEQRRLLTVGACLTCHAAASRVMQDLLRGTRSVAGRLSAKCRVPIWEAGEPGR